MKSKRKTMIIFQIMVTLLGIIVTVVGVCSKNLDVMSAGILIIWIGNMIFCLEEFQKRFFFFLFQCTFFTFLLGRIVVSYLRGQKWWTEIGQAYENNCFAVVAIAISLVSLYLGAVITEYFWNRKKTVNFERNESKIEYRKNLQAIALCVFLVTFIFFCIQEGEKLFYVWDKSYVEYYTGFHQQFPFWVYTIASFMKYSLCLYLATLPSKKRSFIPLVMYVISNIPSLLIGMRNPIVLSILFALSYYVLRNILDNKEKWFGRLEKICIAITIPVGVVFLAAYSYIRSDQALKTINPFSLFTEFFYGQGVTLNVLTRGYGYRLNLPEREFRNYTFGGIIDYIVHGNVGQLLFGTEALPEGNCWTNGRISNNLSHNLSYVIMKEDYLNGRGLGSSYILENYIDFGYLGVAIFSLILGYLLIWFIRGIGKNCLLNTIILVSLTEIFYIPRAEATGWLTFIVTLQFWACIIACYVGTWILAKWKWPSLLLEKLRIKVKE